MELLLIWITSSVVTVILAGRYNRSAGAWFLWSLIFGFLATLVLLAMGDARQSTPTPSLAALLPQPDERYPCPRCGESIARLAKVCRFCGTTEVG